MNTHLVLRKLLLYAIASLVIVGCKKTSEGPQTPIPIPSTKKISKVTMNESDSLVFEYTSNGLLKKVTSTEFEVNNEAAIFNFSYDGFKNVHEITTSAGTGYKFIYQDNKLRMIENYLAGKKVAENIIEWANGKISANTLFTGFEGTNGGTVYKPTFKAIYTYDATGDLKKLSLNTVTANHTLVPVNEKLIDEYHNSNNPLAILEPLSLVSFFMTATSKNVLKETLLDEHGQVEETTVNSYVFDAEKQLASSTSTVTAPGYTPTIINLKYYYK